MARWYDEDWDDHDGYRGWAPYVPVAERRQRALRQIAILARLGLRVQPVPAGKSGAQSVWGQAWCQHLESFSDYANRLPRGRSYVRHGAVVHLELEPQMIRALVEGTRTYHVEIAVAPLAAATWQTIRRECGGQIGTMIELLEGRISSEVMAVVAHRDRGLLPRPREIELNCSCPDWAVMCKHVAAVLYGVGRRLDTEPELLFELRGVDPQDLIAGGIAATVDAGVREDALDEGDLGAIFGVELDEEAPPVVRVEAAEALAPTAEDVRRLRLSLGLSVQEFADRLGVSLGSVYRWENQSGELRLRRRARKALRELMGEQGG